MSKNTNLNIAKSTKIDEFYTQLCDIENELQHYTKYFKNKVVFCNCDDPTWSEFWRYFHINFTKLGLKKLISTHYNKDKHSYKLEYIGGDDNNVENGTKTPLSQNGDFRSDECVEILKTVDIVVTNPPFSLFKEYIAQLTEYKKKFLIIGSLNAVSYKDVFPLIKDNKLWLGYNSVKEFKKPDGNIQKFGNIYWYTNLKIDKTHNNLILSKEYNEKDYPKYDNFDIINIDKVSDIPKNYEGVMGVPITFILKYDPKEFKILGIANDKRWLSYKCFTLINKKAKYQRILIKRL